MLHRRFVGKPIAHTELYAVDTRRAIDPYDLHGKTMVLGWFDSATCTGCAPVFGKIAAWLHNSTMNNEVVMLAISPPSMHRRPAVAFDQLRLYAKALEVPLAMTDETQFDQFALSDHERINFMVVDGHGIVQYVGPVAPSADDCAAALDELFAAAEQAQRRHH